jgi:hypothetical protein
MELAGLEPATSWVRSSCSSERELASLQRFSGERLECRNISRNNSAAVLHSDNEYPGAVARREHRGRRSGLLVRPKRVAVLQCVGDGRVVTHLPPFGPSGLERLIVDGGARNR